MSSGIPLQHLTPTQKLPAPGKQEPRRDLKGAYKITLPTGHKNAGQIRSYTRVSTIAGTLEDTLKLHQWEARHVAKGLAADQELINLAIGAHPDDDRTLLDDIVTRAKANSKSNKAADQGTALHRFTELWDHGAQTLKEYPEQYRPHLDVYDQAIQQSGFRIIPELTETVIINDHHGYAGSVDRILEATKQIDLKLPAGVKKRLKKGDRIIGDLKGLPVYTPLATPDGWTTMGDVQIGDQVFDRSGQPTTVTAKSDIHAKDCYRITFDDGTSVVADHDHRWWIGATRWSEERVLTTEEIKAQLHDPSSGSKHLHIKQPAPIQCPPRELPIEPYLLGAWLGDGHKRGGAITKPSERLWNEIQGRGHTLGQEWKQNDGTRTVLGLRTKLIATGLQYNKHIPDEYMRASEQQRRDLLAGLMDTDGSYNKARKECVYYSTDKQLAENVEELLLTLGYRTYLSEYEANGFGLTTTAYAVKFRATDASPFITKAEQFPNVVPARHRSWRRLITDVEPVPTVATQCIAVDSPDSSYLCGRAMLPTHNTGKVQDYKYIGFATQVCAYAHHTATWHVDHAHPDGGTRQPAADIRTDVAVIIHLPASDPAPACRLHTVDLEHAYEYYETALIVRGLRSAGVKRKLIGEHSATHPTKTVTAPKIETPTRDGLHARIAALADNEQALTALVNRWPDNTPRPLPNELSEEQTQALHTAVSVVEAQHDVPL